MKPLLIIGPLCKDILIKEDKKISKIGGALYYQSFVYEQLNIPYILAISLAKKDETLLNHFPNKTKIKPIFKNETISFINQYVTPEERIQSSNFSNIPITKNDIEPILKNNQFSAIILNPLLRTDFSQDLINYLKNIKIPIYLSLQGYLRTKNEDNKVKLFKNHDIKEILSNLTGLFLDQNEAKVLFNKQTSLNNIANNLSKMGPEEVIITKAHKGSIIYSKITNSLINIPAVKVKEVNYPTGSGDTFMAAYLSKRLSGSSIIFSANYASKLTSLKIEKGYLNL